MTAMKRVLPIFVTILMVFSVVPVLSGTAYAHTHDYDYNLVIPADVTVIEAGQFMEDEDHPDRLIHVFNSKSASIGETLIARKIWECEKEGFSFEHTIEIVEAYIESQVTWVVLETLDTLRKNGRLSNFKAALATALKIKPICSSTPEGAIQQAGQARGINKALVRMVEMAAEAAGHAEQKEIAVSYVECPERGQMVLDALKERIPAKNYILLPASGLTATYANEGV